MDKTKADFDVEREREIARLTKKICPLTGDNCMTACMCFFEGSVHAINDRWALTPPTCTSPLITGVILTQNQR